MKLIKLTDAHDQGDPSVWINTDKIVSVESLYDGGSWVCLNDRRSTHDPNSLLVTESPDQIAAMIQWDGGANWYQSLLLGNVIKYDKARDLPDDETVRRIISESVNLWLACKARREATNGETEDGDKITITAEEWRQRGINEKAILDRIEGKI